MLWTGSKESSGSSSDESSTHENEELSERKDNTPPRLLSEEEINKLGAQIIKAELIGDQTLAQKLKQQLQTAQKDRSATAAPATVTRSDDSNTRKGSDDKIAILTRTDRFGMTRPVAKHQNPTTQLCGGHRKRKVGYSLVSFQSQTWLILLSKDSSNYVAFEQSSQSIMWYAIHCHDYSKICMIL